MTRDWVKLITSVVPFIITMKPIKLSVKSTKEMLQVLDETKEAFFKDKKTLYPYTQWEHKRAQIKERLNQLPEYVHQAVEVINIEEQKMGRPPKLDKYYSMRRVIRMFDRSVSLFLIPKKNIAKIGAWADILTRMMASPVDFLSEYFQRNLSESGFSADKGRFGSIIRQRREDRQQTALFSNALFHNIYTVRINPK
jgi:hypothetical protein